MKEVFIHQYSRLFYSEYEQTFIYTADTLELAMFCSEGIQMEQDNVTTHENDMLILEGNRIYSFHVPAQATILISKVPIDQEEIFQQYYQSKFQHEEIRTLCLFMLNQQGLDKLDEMLLQSYAYKLAYLIMNHYGYQSDTDKQRILLPNEERMKQIHKIIYTQSSDDISLVSLAKQLHLTPQYVSQFFKEYFGCTFLHYVANVRLYKAMPDIQHTNKNLLSIAMEHGFANIRSFQMTFDKVYHCTPKQYRKMLQTRTSFESAYQDDPIFKAFKEKQINLLPANAMQLKQETYQVSLAANEKGIQLHHTWRNLMTVGRARLLLIDDIRKQISEIQKDIGFKTIRFHGIFNDDMHVYDEDDQGNPIYNFHQVNDVLDFLLKIGLRPFVELGFMPKKLALYPDMAIIDQIFIVSPPKDMKKWQEFIQAFIKNCINRYGEEEVQDWNFEFWNNGGLDYKENESRNRKFWQGTMDEYLTFYEATYHAVKDINSSLRFGGPSISILVLKKFPENMVKYIQYMNKHKCMVDFVTFHVYPSFQGDLNGEYTTDLPPFKERVETLQKWMKKQNVKVPLHITEWSTWGYKRLPNFNDGCAKALYLIESMVNTLDQVDSFGHWTCSDYTETMNTKENYIFSDKAGLITNNGIKKVAYHAYTFMRRLGDVMLSKGDNYIFTKRNKNYQLLLYRACNDKQAKKAYSNFHMNIKQLPNGTYEKKITYLNKESGSAYDVWKKMGSRLEIMEEDVEYLKASSLMSYERETIEIVHNEDMESRRLSDNEAILIEWNYKFR